MVVSENVLSPSVKETLSLQHSRYHASFYGGTKIFQKIYSQTQELANKIFHCSHSIISPLSGNMAVLAVILALTKPDDKIAILPLSAGGYPINLEFLYRKRVNIPFNLDEYNIDLSTMLEIIAQEKPELIFLGSSLFLFSHPVQPIAKAVHEYGGIVAYDGSHVLGLIAGEQFQDPLKEGADLLLGSTHKSFPGPQGGVILSNGFYERELEEVIGAEPLEGIVLVDNIHNSRVAALGVAFEEFQHFGRNYARQVVINSKTLAQTLDSNTIPLHGKSNGFTESHQVIMKVQDFDEGAKLRDVLLDHRIVTDAAMRFGTAELTRLGLREEEMRIIGDCISQILRGLFKSQKLEPNVLKTINDKIDSLINLTQNAKL
ncbi:MAG: hypothetical protein JSV04_09555 [Candidatus Heimdallarchaeota archaeon]|nr:MAG: hypothetical protein JSV04_09555 [Candidatus Heimdallarchaeota archaeon]